MSLRATLAKVPLPTPPKKVGKKKKAASTVVQVVAPPPRRKKGPKRASQPASSRGFVPTRLVLPTTSSQLCLTGRIQDNFEVVLLTGESIVLAFAPWGSCYCVSWIGVEGGVATWASTAHSPTYYESAATNCAFKTGATAKGNIVRAEKLAIRMTATSTLSGIGGVVHGRRTHEPLDGDVFSVTPLDRNVALTQVCRDIRNNSVALSAADTLHGVSFDSTPQTPGALDFQQLPIAASVSGASASEWAKEYVTQATVATDPTGMVWSPAIVVYKNSTVSTVNFQFQVDYHTTFVPAVGSFLASYARQVPPSKRYTMPAEPRVFWRPGPTPTLARSGMGLTGR